MLATQRADPALYATAATVIPVFWLGLLYQVNAWDLDEHPPLRVLVSLMVFTAAAGVGEFQAFSALFNTHHGELPTTREAVANGLFLTGYFVFVLPAWKLVAKMDDAPSNLIVGVLFLGVAAFVSVYVSTHV